MANEHSTCNAQLSTFNAIGSWAVSRCESNRLLSVNLWSLGVEELGVEEFMALMRVS
jgi:hypothetical protein